MIKHSTKPLTVLATTLIALAAAAAVAAVMAQTDTQPKVFPANPWADKSDAERQADVDAAHKRNDEYLVAFIASKQDPRSLPVIEIDSYAAPLADLSSSVEAADVIVRGMVEDTTFEVNPSGGLPVMVSTVRIASVDKGTVTAGVVSVRQLGGPVAQPDGGAFARLDNDEPILPGDDVILFLQRASAGQYTPQPGTGVYFVKDGRTYAEEANPFGDQMSGLSATEVTKSIESVVQSQP
jgi:hypothetical protein